MVENDPEPSAPQTANSKSGPKPEITPPPLVQRNGERPSYCKVVSKTSHVREELESLLEDVCSASLSLSAQDKERIVSTSVIRGRLEGLQVLPEATPSDDDQDQLPY